MIKIGAKLVKNHKTISKTSYISINNYDHNSFFEYMVEICKKLDIATPIITDYHVNDYEKFNFVKFTESDFIDTQHFDYLLLENDDR